jgi:hypothetical protein
MVVSLKQLTLGMISVKVYSPEREKNVVPLNQLTLRMTPVKECTALMEAKWLCL